MAEWFSVGILVGTLAFGLGYYVRGSDVQNDSRLEQLSVMNDTLRSIALNLPPQKTVTVEKVVQAPFCEFAEKELVNKSIRDAIPDIPVKSIDVCKRLMDFGSGGNTYDAIGQWIKTSPAKPDGLEDKIMAHVLSTLIFCFQNT